MKTFSEAVESTMMRRHRPGSNRDKAMNDIQRGLEPYHGLHAEVQTSAEAAAFASGLIHTISKDELDERDLAELVIVAFSHGVMVGIEMEKQPLLWEP